MKATKNTEHLKTFFTTNSNYLDVSSDSPNCQMNGEENSKENVHIYGDTYDVHPANFSHFFRGNDTKCNRRIKKKNDNLRSQLLLLN